MYAPIVLLRAAIPGCRRWENIGLGGGRSGDVRCYINNTHTHIFMYDDVFCRIEWAPLFTAPWTGSPDGRVPITAAPTVRAPLCVCVCVHLWMCVDANAERERERCSPPHLCAFQPICLQGMPYVCVCVCVDGVRVSQRRHTVRHQCDIPSKASSEPFTHKGECSVCSSGGLARPRSLGLSQMAPRRRWLDL